MKKACFNKKYAPTQKNPLGRRVGALGHPNPTLTENWRFAPNPTQPNGKF